MNEAYRNILVWIVGIFGVIALIEGAFLLLFPQPAARLIHWWTTRGVTLLRNIGRVVFVVGIVILGCAIAAVQNGLIAATLIIGTLCVAVGVIYHFPPALRMILRPWTRDLPVWMRSTGGVICVIGILLLVLALVSRAPTQRQTLPDSTPTTHAIPPP